MSGIALIISLFRRIACTAPCAGRAVGPDAQADTQSNQLQTHPSVSPKDPEEREVLCKTQKWQKQQLNESTKKAL